MSAVLDRDTAQSKALVIDGNATSRSTLGAQLRDLGFGTVVQCGRVVDARAQLEARSFDVVLCEQDFAGTDYSGQQLLDDLRRHQLLPLSTVFIMITGEATYAKVAEAAESALDGYLLKPHTAASLAERLSQARRRKKALREIFAAVDEGRHDAAAALCVDRLRARGEFWQYAARIGAELLLGLGRHADARILFEAMLKVQPAPWARLGVARAQAEANETSKAIATLEALVAEQPAFADAHDVAARLHLEQGNFADALKAARAAAALTPGSVSRLQRHGIVAFYYGEADEASRALERAVALGAGSKMFEPQALLLLAFVRFRRGDTKGLQRYVDDLAHALSRAPESRRLQRMLATAEALGHLLHRQGGAATLAAVELAEELREPSFDAEAACNLLTLRAELAANGIDGGDAHVDAIGLRHCASRGLTELLARAAAPHAPFAERIKACQQQVAQMSEEAMTHSLAGDPATSVRMLLAHGKATLNAKLIDTARLVLQRHAARIDDAAAFAPAVEDLRQRHADGARFPFGEGQGRKAGGLALRTNAPTPAGAAAPPQAVAAA